MGTPQDEKRSHIKPNAVKPEQRDVGAFGDLLLKSPVRLICEDQTSGWVQHVDGFECWEPMLALITWLHLVTAPR